MSWESANEACGRIGGSLAQIQSLGGKMKKKEKTRRRRLHFNNEPPEENDPWPRTPGVNSGPDQEEEAVWDDYFHLYEEALKKLNVTRVIVV